MTQLALHTKKLLLVDDEPELLSLLETVFKAEGFTNIVTALDVASALDTFQKVQPDLAILDVSLPDGDGFTLCSYLRTLSKGAPVPVIFLTAKDETADRLMGLKSGADDYLTKPFRTRELLARLRALGRRSLRSADGALAFGDIELNRGASLLVCGENSVRLSEKEFRILEYLIANAGQILTREQLAVKIWGYESDAEYNNVEVYMSFARKKLNFVKARTEIKAVRGVGYELRHRDV